MNQCVWKRGRQKSKLQMKADELLEERWDTEEETKEEVKHSQWRTPCQSWPRCSVSSAEQLLEYVWALQLSEGQWRRRGLAPTGNLTGMFGWDQKCMLGNDAITDTLRGISDGSRDLEKWSRSQHDRAEEKKKLNRSVFVVRVNIYLPYLDVPEFENHCIFTKIPRSPSGLMK